ncbi:hypothetical protein BCR35DRAFT_137227 [Leucosporidium creatinivorum]|uniref:LIM zinc-binding domain-containing protein n=1 Tax=Leucosporidium creatinivorum TaxID=106004 RepID=A0A1Y2G0Y7_9BASI|nr:hypothetical protein BCR35DRAFT_137227 [Leucosporidium creatinivorum]
MRREPQKDGEKEKASRLRMEREKSPMVPSFEELGEKLRRAGLEDPHPSTAMKAPVTDNIKLPSNPVSSPRETTRPLATSSPYQRSVKPLPIPPAFSNPPSTTSIPSTATPRPTHSRAWSMNPTSTPNPASATPLASPAITSATSRPSHTRARSLNSTPKTTTPIASQPYASTTTPPAWARPNPAVSSSSPWSKALQSEPQASQIEAPPPSSPTRPTPLLPTVPRRHLHVSLKPFDTKPIPSSLASPIKGLNSPKKGGPVAEEMCPACSKPLGYGEFIQLPKTGEVLHRGCFVCGGCGEQLDAGRHTEAEGKVWHSQVSRDDGVVSARGLES